jgi:hypothetical protein
MSLKIGSTTLLFVAALSSCTSLVGDTRSAPEMIAASQARGDPEVRFQRYGSFTFLGKYRIQHEWIQAHPALGGQGGCSYAWAGTAKDEYGHFVPTRAGLDMWEANDVLYQKDFSSRTGLPQDRDMTIHVIGKYRPKAPGGPWYLHEHMCRTYFEPLANEYELWLKKSSLDAMQIEDQNTVATRWNYARLLKPIAYEAIRFANLPAQRVTWIYSFAPEGMENNPTPFVKEELRVPIGDTGYVYQLAFTLSDTIVQNEPEKAARRKAYWQDSFRIDALQR